MVYPTFEIKSIQDRCSLDLRQFLENNQLSMQDPTMQDIAGLNLDASMKNTKQDLLNVAQVLMKHLISISGHDDDFDYGYGYE